MLRPFTQSLLNSESAARVRLFLNKPDPSTPDEVAAAARILNDAPRTTSPLEVARYFEQIKERNADHWLYTAEWPGSRENPVILAFFLQATDSSPYKGDATAWCAAFMNWCLVHTGKIGTRSSSSGSFRCYGDRASEPIAGDIAVFKNRGEDDLCYGTGHVGFLLEESQDSLEVLGGNQGDRIKISTFQKKFVDDQPALFTIRDVLTVP